jgi:hypothetical protein
MGCYDVYCGICNLPFSMPRNINIQCSIKWVNHSAIHMKDGTTLLADYYDGYGRFYVGDESGELIYELTYDDHGDPIHRKINHVACQDITLDECALNLAEMCCGQEFDLEKLLQLNGDHILRRPYIPHDDQDMARPREKLLLGL